MISAKTIVELLSMTDEEIAAYLEEQGFVEATEVDPEIIERGWRRIEDYLNTQKSVPNDQR